MKQTRRKDKGNNYVTMIITMRMIVTKIIKTKPATTVMHLEII